MLYETFSQYRGYPIEKIIQWLVDDYCENNGLRKASSINKGYCDLFAEDLVEELGGKTDITYIIDNDELAPDDSYRIGTDHVWVYHNGKHYDAETPYGVDNFLELPHFKRWLKNKKHT